MTIEERDPVEEAKLNLWMKVDEHRDVERDRAEGDDSHMSGCTCCCWDCEPAMDALIEAVRQQERERVITEAEHHADRGWDRFGKWVCGCGEKFSTHHDLLRHRVDVVVERARSSEEASDDQQ